MTPLKRTPNGKGLTVAKNKVAILLRVPKELNASICKLAKSRTKGDRTAMIYQLLATHPDMPAKRPIAGKK